MGYPIYSAREIIASRHSVINKKAIPVDRAEYKAFCLEQKQHHGAHTFIHEMVEKFSRTNEQVAIIESVRSPGEVAWIKTLTHLPNGEQVDVALVHITADEMQRLEWFMRRDDALTSELTPEKFYEQEKISNSGDEPWAENISLVASEADFVVENVKGRLGNSVDEILDFIMRFPKMKKVEQTF